MSRPIPNARRPHEVPRTAIRFDPDQGLTHQSFKDECDATRIVETYARTGLVTHSARGKPKYGDAPEIDLFQAACAQAEIRSKTEEGYEWASEDATREPESVPDATSEDTLGDTLGVEPEATEAVQGE